MNNHDNTLADVLGLQSDDPDIIQDKDGVFDRTREPARAFAMYEDVISYFQTTSVVVERALLAKMVDGEQRLVDTTDLYEDVDVIAVRREGDSIVIDELHTEQESTNADESRGVQLSYKERAVRLQQEVIANSYYVDLYDSALVKYSMSRDGVSMQSYDDSDLNDMFNEFWFNLPDGPQIRRTPFFLLCDLATGD